MQDIRQSQMYGNAVQRMGWVVEEVDGIKIFIKKFPLIGSVIKIQRPDRLPPVKLLDELARKYRARSVSIESSVTTNYLNPTKSNFRITNNPYLPTKTIRIDVTGNEEKIFQRFTEAKRRAVRKAVKNGVTVKQSKDINEFIKLKSKDFWPIHFLMTKDVRTLWQSFQPKNIVTLNAYSGNILLASILLLFFDGASYYWMAASTSEGKKLFAPTLLVWEALKLAKEKKCKVFDFEGVYDDRFHNATKKWKGFTKFKEGFGGKEVIFPEPLIKHYHTTF